jgi:lipopolysaccharide transport system permease protein
MFKNNIFQDIFEYRHYIFSSVKTEFYSKYKRSKIGIVWMIIHPFMQILIYALVLSAIMKAKFTGIESQYAYAIYLISGIIGWNLFSDISSRLLTVFIDNGNLIKKVSFPRILLPMVIVGVSLVNFLLMFVSMFIIFAILGHFSIEHLIWLPLLILITLLNAIGVGLFFGVINIFIRDVGQIMTIGLHFWFWLTPIVYSLEMLPDSYKFLFTYNPLYGLITGYQSILAYNSSPSLKLLIYPSISGIVLFFLALFVLKKANYEMSDVL